jgi:GNAT superfamily N-acetyltransferase
MLQIVPVHLHDPVAEVLIGELLVDLAERYGQEDAAPAPTVEDLTPPDGVFLVAAVDGVVAGCGGIRRHTEGSAEVKRMYVRPEARGSGVARELLAALEGFARESGYSEVRLETGTGQPEAIALYRSAGYLPVAPYGYYAEYPDSRCFAKALTGDE